MQEKMEAMREKEDIHHDIEDKNDTTTQNNVFKIKKGVFFFQDNVNFKTRGDA